MVKTRVSAFMDGELDVHEAEQTMGGLKQDVSLRREWTEFHLIGAAMRRERRLDVDITASVMKSLGDEPTVLSPRVSSAGQRLRPLLALAASAAGVMVVMWVALGPVGPTGGGAGEAAQMAKANVSHAKPAANSEVVVNDKAGMLHDYLVAHHAHAPKATMAEGTRYVRMVSVATERP